MHFLAGSTAFLSNGQETEAKKQQCIFLFGVHSSSISPFYLDEDGRAWPSFKVIRLFDVKKCFKVDYMGFLVNQSQKHHLWL